MRFGKLGALGGLGTTGSGGGLVPAIRLSNTTVPEDASVGDPIGLFTISGPYTGTPVFALDDDAGGLFALDGDTLEVGSALDYETTTSHQIVASVSGVDPPVPPKALTIAVTDVTEGPGLSVTFWPPKYFPRRYFPTRYFG